MDLRFVVLFREVLQIMKRESSVWYQHREAAHWVDEYPECSIYEHLRSTSGRYPELTAIEFEGRRFSYRAMLEEIDRLARALYAMGIRKGDVVSIVTPNIPQALYMIYAVNRLGGVSNMIHPLLSQAEIQRFVENTNSAAVLTLDMIYPKFAGICWGMERQPKMILCHVADALSWYAKPVYLLKNRVRPKLNPKHDVLDWHDLMKLSRDVDSLPADDGSGDDTAVILYSGGTSGTPKGVMITNRNMNALALHTYDIGGIDEVVGKKSLAVMPIFHGYGLVICLHAMICLGFHVYLLPKYDFRACGDLIFRKRINCIYGVPGLFEALMRDPRIEKDDLSFMELLVSGGDKLPEKLQRRMSDLLRRGGAKVVLQEAYGQTECVAGCALNPGFDIRPGSAGIAYPDVQFKIVAPGTRESLPTGEYGELCVSGPIVMKGYYRDPEATQKALRTHDDGRLWLHTGDIFRMDEDGYIYFHQRSSRMLICGGYNIYMTQVEDVISSCPAVAQCCVVGIQDRIYGQRIGACVVLNNPDADRDAVSRQILEQCRGALAEYSIPHEIIYMEQLPLTNLGKIDYLTLEQEVNSKRSVSHA